MTDTAASRPRSNSISEYSQLFSQNTPKPASFINQKRHPSLSMKHDRSTSIGRAGLNVSGFTAYGNENAIDDSDSTTQTASTTASSTLLAVKSKKNEDPVGLGRRLSQGARAIMYNGNRMRGESIAEHDVTRPKSNRSLSQSSSIASPRLGPSELAQASPPQESFTAAESAKTIKRRLSPTGERMLRGELAFH